MNIGIVVYSKTGNTLEVASSLHEMFLSNGHSSKIERIIPKDEDEFNINKIELNEISDLSGYDLVVFASPVNAFSLAPVMKKYMSSIHNLSVPAICFVTKALPFKWTGGIQAISKMKYYIGLSGGNVINTAIINWDSKRDDRIKQSILEVSKELK